MYQKSSPAATMPIITAVAFRVCFILQLIYVQVCEYPSVTVTCYGGVLNRLCLHCLCMPGVRNGGVKLIRGCRLRSWSRGCYSFSSCLLFVGDCLSYCPVWSDSSTGGGFRRQSNNRRCPGAMREALTTRFRS